MKATTVEAMGRDRQGVRADEEFGEIYTRERPGLVRLAFLMTGSAAAAEELVQDAFVGWHEASGNGAGIDNPAAFLRVVLVRRCSTWRSRRRTEASKVALLGEPGDVGEPEIDETWLALARIRPDRRVPLVLRYYADLEFGVIADMLDVPAATVRTRVHRGLQDLRKELGDGR